MGATHVTVTIRNPAEPDRTWEALFLVDTGATDCLVPRPGLEAIGLQPRGQRVYELADGREMTADITVAEIEFMGEIVGGTIIFGDADAEPLLGVTALESVGIEVDPLNQRLKRLPAVRLKSGIAVTTPDCDKEQRGMIDEIMKELWEIKNNIARKHGYDVRRIVAHFQTRPRPERHQVADLRASRESRTKPR